ncbi:hypothetical protein NDA14_007575 [Ustilago hordei]|nr:hypothetical protein NDA14_007575 [Ustilago hordei]UTT90733.1 hypothetical protein NDA17_001123 [Ustilago hordei]
MLNHNYSAYEDFIQDAEDIIHRLLIKLQSQFHRMIKNNVYGMMEEPKDRTIFAYSNRMNRKQVVTLLTILIKCASHLYFATHKLGPFHDHFDLRKQMRACINFLITNQDSDASCILDLKIESNKASTSTGNMPYYHVADISQHDTQDVMSSGSEAQHTETSEKPLGGETTPDKPLHSQDATPTTMPELMQLTNHHLKVLTGLSDKLKWDEKDLLDPKRVLVTTFADADSLLHSIIMGSFSPQLQSEYFLEWGDRPIEISVDLYDWAINKCRIHSDSKEYELLKAMYALKWDQVGSWAYNFLTRWEVHVSELHAYLTKPWTLTQQYKTLKQALPGDRNRLFNLIFVLYETLIEEHTTSSVANVLCKCYRLAANSAPVCLSNTANNIDLNVL